MGSFHQQRSNKMIGASRFVVVALAAVLASGGAFAAVGGTEGVKQIFVTLRMVDSDGEVVQGFLIEQLGETDEQTVLDLDLGDGKSATMMFDHMNVNDDDAILEGAAAGIFQLQLGVDDDVNNRSFFTNETVAFEGASATIEIIVGDGDESSDPTSTQLVELTGADNQLVVVLTDGNNANGESALSTAMSRFGNFPKHIDTFELDEADIIHSWIDDDGEAFDLIMYGVTADDGNGDVYLFKAYEGDDGQRVYDNIGQMSGVDPELLEVTTVDMDGSAITLAFDHDGNAMKMIVDTNGQSMSFGKKRLLIESQGGR